MAKGKATYEHNGVPSGNGQKETNRQIKKSAGNPNKAAKKARGPKGATKGPIASLKHNLAYQKITLQNIFHLLNDEKEESVYSPQLRVNVISMIKLEGVKVETNTTELNHMTDKALHAYAVKNTNRYRIKLHEVTRDLGEVSAHDSAHKAQNRPARNSQRMFSSFHDMEASSSSGDETYGYEAYSEGEAGPANA
jgi:hypothetical protein